MKQNTNIISKNGDQHLLQMTENNGLMSIFSEDTSTELIQVLIMV